MDFPTFRKIQIIHRMKEMDHQNDDSWKIPYPKCRPTQLARAIEFITKFEGSEKFRNIQFINSRTNRHEEYRKPVDDLNHECNVCGQKSSMNIERKDISVDSLLVTQPTIYDDSVDVPSTSHEASFTCGKAHNCESIKQSPECVPSIQSENLIECALPKSPIVASLIPCVQTVDDSNESILNMPQRPNYLKMNIELLQPKKSLWDMDLFRENDMPADLALFLFSQNIDFKTFRRMQIVHRLKNLGKIVLLENRQKRMESRSNGEINTASNESANSIETNSTVELIIDRERANTIQTAVSPHPLTKINDVKTMRLSFSALSGFGRRRRSIKNNFDKSVKNFDGFCRMQSTRSITNHKTSSTSHRKTKRKKIGIYSTRSVNIEHRSNHKITRTSHRKTKRKKIVIYSTRSVNVVHGKSKRKKKTTESSIFPVAIVVFFVALWQQMYGTSPRFRDAVMLNPFGNSTVSTYNAIHIDDESCQVSAIYPCELFTSAPPIYGTLPKFKMTRCSCYSNRSI